MLAKEYGIAFQVPTDPKIAAFAGFPLTIVSKTGGSAPGGTNLPAGSFCRRVRYRFAGRYGIKGAMETGAFLVGGYGILGPLGVPVRREQGLLGVR